MIADTGGMRAGGPFLRLSEHWSGCPVATHSLISPLEQRAGATEEEELGLSGRQFAPHPAQDQVAYGVLAEGKEEDGISSHHNPTSSSVRSKTYRHEVEPEDIVDP